MPSSFRTCAKEITANAKCMCTRGEIMPKACLGLAGFRVTTKFGICLTRLPQGM